MELTLLEFRLLTLLVRYAGLVLSRSQLILQVWGADFYGDERIVDAHIRHIRRKIERDPKHPTLIRTVRGVGYQMVRPSP